MLPILPCSGGGCESWEEQLSCRSKLGSCFVVLDTWVFTVLSIFHTHGIHHLLLATCIRKSILNFLCSLMQKFYPSTARLGA
jgi:hypothetical protein